jgi:hypothetical protein
MVLILSLITCGLYGLIWLWQAETEVKQELELTDTNPGLDVVLTVLTLGIWFLVAVYRLSKHVAEAQRRVNLVPNDLSLVTVIVSALGFWFVAITLLQVELNKVWAVRSGGLAAIA